MKKYHNWSFSRNPSTGHFHGPMVLQNKLVLPLSPNQDYLSPSFTSSVKGEWITESETKCTYTYIRKHKSDFTKQKNTKIKFVYALLTSKVFIFFVYLIFANQFFANL